MDQVAGYLQKIEGILRQLTDNHQKIKNEKDLLIRQSVIQQRTIETQNIEIENLKKQVEALKIAKSVDTDQESGRAKEKIQDLVREIDRCIELLNK